MSSPDVVFIHPGAQRQIFGPLAEHGLTALEPPTWTRMLAGYVRDRGRKVVIIDAEVDGLTPAEVAAQTIMYDPALTVISVYGSQPSASTQQMVGAGAIARAIRDRMPHYETLMVGNHCSALPERTLKEEATTFVCDGEGPHTIMGLLDYMPEQMIPGLVYWDNGRVIRNPTAPLIEDLDKDLHGDVWDLLSVGRYRAHGWECFNRLTPRSPYASIYTTLGCPHRCRFCMINTFQHSNRYRRFSPEFIVKQMVKLHDEYGVQTFKIADEMFLLAENHYMAIAEGLIEAGMGKHTQFWCYGRIDSVKPKTLATLRRAGCTWIGLGIEAGSKYVRDGADKHFKNHDIAGIVRQIQDADISVAANFIVGLSGDTAETMQETLDLAIQIQPEWANIYAAQAYPGSGLYDDAVAAGTRLPEDWSGYSQHSYTSAPLPTATLTSEEVLRFRDAAFTKFFTDPSYLSRIERKFGVGTRAEVEAMTRVKLKRKILGDAP